MSAIDIINACVKMYMPMSAVDIINACVRMYTAQVEYVQL